MLVAVRGGVELSAFRFSGCRLPGRRNAMIIERIPLVTRSGCSMGIIWPPADATRNFGRENLAARSCRYRRHASSAWSRSAYSRSNT
jgi:hypothetical protein